MWSPGADLGHLEHRPRAVVEAAVAERAGPRDEVHRRPIADLRVERDLVPAAVGRIVGLRAEERHAVFARRRLAALAVDLLLPLRELVVLLVLGEREEQAARREDVISLLDDVELEFAVGLRGGGEDDGVEPRRQVPQVRDRFDLGRGADFREALADARGLVQVELHAGGRDAADRLDEVGDRPGRAERDADRRPDAMGNRGVEREEVCHSGIVRPPESGSVGPRSSQKRSRPPAYASLARKSWSRGCSPGSRPQASRFMKKRPLR